MSKYAEGTSVPPSQSRVEIERTLERFGATGFLYGTEETRAMIGFRLKGRLYRIVLEYPELKSFRYTKNYIQRTDLQMKNASDQEIRRLWRSLLIIIKAKLTAVNDGISTLEKEFLADIVLPDNQTFGEWAAPQIEEMYQSGHMPGLLPGTNNQKLLNAPNGYVEGQVL